MVTLQAVDERREDQEESEAVDRYFLKLFDDQTFEELDAFELNPMEHGCSISTVPYDHDRERDDARAFVAVGTANVIPGHDEPESGRVLLFRISSRRLQLESELDVGDDLTLNPHS